MQKVKLGMLALIAVFAFGAVMVESASATLPEFKAEKFPVSFTSENVLPLKPTLESFIETTSKKANIDCEMSKDVGVLSGPNTISKVLVDYTGCKEENAPTKICTTSGATKGLIVTKDIMGIPGYITGTGLAKLGIELLPESGKVFAEFTCEGEAEKVTVEGCLIGQATPVNTLSDLGSLIFEANAADNGPLYTELENGINKPCELTVKAGFLGIGKGKSWNMDNEMEFFGAGVELKG